MQPKDYRQNYSLQKDFVKSIAVIAFFIQLASSTTNIFWCVEHFYWNCSCGYIRWQSVIIYATGFELAHIEEKKTDKEIF